jgi:hypothetical protein
MRGAQADWLVVAVKFLLSRWGWSEGVRSFVACSFDQPDVLREELRERAEIVRQVV